MEIKEYVYDEQLPKRLEKEEKGSDWPVVYLIHNDQKLYIGETTSVSRRMFEHTRSSSKKPSVSGFTCLDVVIDDEFNKSVVLDFEQRLIKSCKVDAKYAVINRNPGQRSTHDYYERHRYSDRFYDLWNELKKKGLTSKELSDIENSNLFKYSPFTALTAEQIEVSKDILLDITQKMKNKEKGLFLVKGCSGTGKTVLAISILKMLVDSKEYLDEQNEEEDKLISSCFADLYSYQHISPGRPLKVGIIFPMIGIRSTMEKLFNEFGGGLSSEMVMNPYCNHEDFDILFVDEAHRLFRRKNMQGFGYFDKACVECGLDPQESNQLDIILKRSKYTVLFYDQDQTIKGSDVTKESFFDSIRKWRGEYVQETELSSQMRCRGGQPFVDYIKDVLNCRANGLKQINNYEFLFFDDVDAMVEKIKTLDDQYGISRTVAGYGWKWRTKAKKRHVPDNMDYYNKLVKSGEYDIDIDGHKYIWNIATRNWINRKDSKYTIGCIHTVQGYDLNYVGVIFGKEIDYNPTTNKLEINKLFLEDKNVKNGMEQVDIEKYVLNMYATMMARGIRGCCVFAYNNKLKQYLGKLIKHYNGIDAEA